MLSENALKIVRIDDDNYVVLLGYFDPVFKGNKILASRNIFLLDRKEHIKWVVQSKIFISGGFVDIFINKNELKAIAWDTGLYKVDLETGLATPEILLK